MIIDNRNLLSKLQLLKSTGQKGFAILIDPGKDNRAYFSALSELLPKHTPDFVFVGGSFVQPGESDKCIAQLKTFCTAPIVLFPGDYTQLSNKADALFFLSLISGRNPEYLIEQHIKSVPWLQANPMEVIPTSYLVVSDSNTSSVLKASKTQPLPTQDLGKILQTAWAGFYQGHQLLYLEAGSGNKAGLPTKVVRQISSKINLPLICGGGISSGSEALEMYKAGADVVVVGNALEETPALLISIYEEIKNQSVKISHE